MVNVQLIHGDCLEVMRGMGANSVDAVITDPPYLTTDLHFDNDGMDMAWVTECIRVVKPNGYLALFAPVVLQAQIARQWSMRFSGAWIKPSSNARTHSAKKPMNQWELYCVFAHPCHSVSELIFNKTTFPAEPYRKVQHNRGYQRGGKDQLDRSDASSWTVTGYVSENSGYRFQSDVIVAPQKKCMEFSERTPHPTQKPVKAMRVLAEWLTNAGGVVLDPFCGSGTTGVACVNTGRNFIGIEIDKGYYDIACKRIEAAQAQMRMAL